MSSKLILMSKYVAESINQTTDCRTFQPRRLSSTAYKSDIIARCVSWLQLYTDVCVDMVFHTKLASNILLKLNYFKLLA